MSDPDERVSRRYRELGRDEPPTVLDAAIVSSAHRAARRGRSRWVGFASIAAVLVLALGITLRMQHEDPGIETSVPQPAPAAAPVPPMETQMPAAPKPRAEAPAAAQKMAAPPQPIAAQRDAELARIAALREQGKDAEADEALARFRERHPGYTIPDAMWARVKPR